jgi:hypothetical protein
MNEIILAIVTSYESEALDAIEKLDCSSYDYAMVWSCQDMRPYRSSIVSRRHLSRSIRYRSSSA